MEIRLAGVNRNSIVDGKGMRYTVFTQGCKHNCEGCHNPETHSMTGGTLIDIDKIVDDFKGLSYYDGITLSGGDPFFQLEASMKLAKKVKDLGKNVWCYTGFTFEQIIKDNDKKEMLKYIDVLVDGRFDISKKTLDKAFVGSFNQRIIDVKKSIGAGKVIEMDV